MGHVKFNLKTLQKRANKKIGQQVQMTEWAERMYASPIAPRDFGEITGVRWVFDAEGFWCVHTVNFTGWCIELYAFEIEWAGARHGA